MPDRPAGVYGGGGGQGRFPGRGMPGWGGGGGFNLNAQIQGLEGFDPSTMINYMVNLRQAMAGRQREQMLQNQNRQSFLASRQRMALRQAAAPTYQPNPFQTNLRDLNYLQSQDPWAGRGHGQVAGQNFFNMPAASALTFGRDVFPNGFANYAQLMEAGRGITPGLGAFGNNQAWGRGF